MQNLAEDITRAVQTYIEDVKTPRFPEREGTILIMCQSHLLIGAASSGSGKTTFTLGLPRALKNPSFKVSLSNAGLTISTLVIIGWLPVIHP